MPDLDTHDLDVSRPTACFVVGRGTEANGGYTIGAIQTPLGSPPTAEDRWGATRVVVMMKIGTQIRCIRRGCRSFPTPSIRKQGCRLSPFALSVGHRPKSKGTRKPHPSTSPLRGYPLYLEAQRAVYALDRNMGHTSDAQSDQLAGAAAVAAQKAGLEHITEIVLSEDGARAFAVERRSAPTFAYVQTAEAVNTTLAQSGAAWMQHAAQQAREAQAPAPVKAPAHDGPTMSI